MMGRRRIVRFSFPQFKHLSNSPHSFSPETQSSHERSMKGQSEVRMLGKRNTGLTYYCYRIDHIYTTRQFSNSSSNDHQAHPGSQAHLAAQSSE